MANSSFDYFRKNSKFAVILLGVLCIMAFVVADPLMQWLNASQSGGGVRRDTGKVAVSWDGGELTEGELGSLVYKRNILAAFLRQVEQAGAFEAMQDGVSSSLPTRVQPLRLPTEYEQGVESDVLRTQVLADAARDAGMVISDATITEYLLALGRDRVSRDTMRDMIGGISFGRSRATPEFVFDLLREALLAQSYLASHTYAQATVTPEQRWTDWLKVNDRVVVETAALSVEDFVDQVDEPSESELSEFFEEYRDVIAAPVTVSGRQLPSPTPGFRKPAKAKLQWVRTSYEEALEAAREEVTDEEIAAFYEENKTMFPKSATDMFLSGGGLEGLEDAGDEEAAEEDSEEAPAEDEAASEEAPAEETAEEAATEEPATEEAATEEMTSDEPAAEEPAAEEPTAEEPATEEPAEAAPEQSSQLDARSPFRLASYLQEDEAEADSEASAEEGETPAEDASTEEAESGDSNALDDFMNSGEEAAADDESDTSETDTGDDAATEAAEPEVEYESLEEVSDEIRTRLAQQKAIQNQQQKLDDLMAVLKQDYNVYFTERIDAEAADKEAPAPPEALIDFQKLAEDNGLEYGETDLLSFFEMQKLDSPTLMYYFQQAEQAGSLAVQVFRRDGIEMFEPDTAYDTDRNFYIVMKIEAEEESEPSLDELRDEVVAAWKKQKAAELALAKAEEMAKEATDAGRSLEDLFADRGGVEIEESDMFGWLEPVATSATGMYGLRLDSPGSPEDVGPDFMEEVFGLEASEAGAALDHGQTKAYVIRVSQREKSRSELREAFLREWQVWPGIYSMQRAHVSEAAQAVLLDLIGGEAPDWKRTPNQSPMEREASEGV